MRGLLHRAQGASSGGEQNTKAHPHTLSIPGAWGRERTEERDRVHEPLVDATDPSAHLMRIPIAGRARGTEACPYNIVRARVGALALTTTVDEYVKQGMDEAPSFCVCCYRGGIPANRDQSPTPVAESPYQARKLQKPRSPKSKPGKLGAPTQGTLGT